MDILILKILFSYEEYKLFLNNEKFLMLDIISVIENSMKNVLRVTCQMDDMCNCSSFQMSG